MTTMTRYADLPTLYADARLRAQSYDKDTNSIACTWTSGATVRRRGPSGFYDELLVVDDSAVRLDRLNAGAPLLDSHRGDGIDNVLGVVISGSARISNGQGRARIKLSSAPGDANIVEKIRTGIIAGVSVGYLTHQVEIIERQGQIPIWRVVDWEPLELSAVAVPADVQAGFRSGQRGVIERSRAALTTLDYWSITACRARMLADQRRLGLPPHREGGSSQRQRDEFAAEPFGHVVIPR